jgi:hypothetical protein
VPDLLENTRREIAERIRELTPLVDEYRRLEQAAGLLGGIEANPSTRKPRRPGRPKTTAKRAVRKTAPAKAAKTGSKGPGRRPAGRRKGSGARGAEARALVQAQPGITIPELAQRMSIKQNYLYRVLPALVKEGKVTKKGKGWHPRGA